MNFAPGLSPEIEPDWKPLEDKIGAGCSEYMYIAGYRLEDGTLIHAYKHVTTRQYVNLSDDGRSWDFTGDGYRETENGKIQGHSL